LYILQNEIRLLFVFQWLSRNQKRARSPDSRLAANLAGNFSKGGVLCNCDAQLVNHSKRLMGDSLHHLSREFIPAAAALVLEAAGVEFTNGDQLVSASPRPTPRSPPMCASDRTVAAKAARRKTAKATERK
jgi:hypothetical protein